MTHKTWLLSLVNAQNSHRHLLSLKDVTLGTPKPSVDANHNTEIAVTAVPGSGYKGTVFLKYTRSKMSWLRTRRGLLSEEPFTLESIVAPLDNTVDDLLSVGDLVSTTTVPVIPLGEIRTLLLVAKPDSLGWVGQTTVDLLFGLPPEIVDFHELMAVTLPSDGFIRPN